MADPENSRRREKSRTLLHTSESCVSGVRARGLGHHLQGDRPGNPRRDRSGAGEADVSDPS